MDVQYDHTVTRLYQNNEWITIDRNVGYTVRNRTDTIGQQADVEVRLLIKYNFTEPDTFVESASSIDSN